MVFDNPRNKGILFVILNTILWSGNYVVGRIIIGEIPPITFNSLRWLVTLVILCCFALPTLKREWQQVKKFLPVIAVCGVISVSLYNPLAYIKNEADILKFVNALISNTKGEGKEGDPFWTKAETLLYCALLGYIIFEGAEEDRNMNTLVDMISGMEVKEDDEDFLNAVDYMFKGLEQRKPNCFAVKQYKKYKLSSGDVCSK